MSIGGDKMKTEKIRQKIRFSDLNRFLKVSAIGGFAVAVVYAVAFAIGFLQGLMVV